MGGAFDTSAAALHQATLAAFGRKVRYTCAGLAAVEVLATFRSAGVRSDPQGVPVHSNAPILGVPTAALPARPRALVDQVNVDGVDWSVAEVLADGEGWATMLLQAHGRVD
jgi:hypothetical protein